MGVDTTTYLEDAKVVYGAIQDQVSTLPALMNLFADGKTFGKPVNEAGIRGFTFLARLAPNWNMGYRPEGVAGVGAAGNQGLKQCTVVLKYAYVPIQVTGQAENLTKGESRAFMQAKALEAKFDMKDIVSHVNVVVAGAERGGQLSTVASAAAGSFTADNTGALPGAIYLRVGMPIDTNAVGGGALTLSAAVITAINYGTRVITVPGTAVNGQAVSLAGEAALTTGAFPYTAEGLISLVSDTGAIQGLDPGVAGQTTWKSTKIDAGATDLSSALLQQLRQFVKNRGGTDVDLFVFPSAQINKYVTLVTTTLHFDVNQYSEVGKKAVDLGFSVFNYAGLTIVEEKDARPDRIFAGTAEMLAKFEAVPLSMAEDEASTWTRIFGSSGIADAVGALLRWYHQLGIRQRSAWGVLVGLNVPTAFQGAPPTF